MDVPKDVGVDGIESTFFGFLHQVRPHLDHHHQKQRKIMTNNDDAVTVLQVWKREREGMAYLSSAARIVDRARDEKLPLAVDDDCSSIVGDVGGRRR